MDDSIDALFFIYQNANNQLSAHHLVNVIDHDAYFQGYSVSLNSNRTFRHDRVVEFLTTELELAPRLAFWHDNHGSLPRQGHALEIHFTGFKAADKTRLSNIAENAGLLVRKSMSGYLDFLCCGYNASAKKIEQAHGQGVFVFSETEFLNFLETGEIPIS